MHLLPDGMRSMPQNADAAWLSPHVSLLHLPSVHLSEDLCMRKLRVVAWRVLTDCSVISACRYGCAGFAVASTVALETSLTGLRRLMQAMPQQTAIVQVVGTVPSAQLQDFLGALLQTFFCQCHLFCQSVAYLSIMH